MACREAVELLARYLDDASSSEERTRMLTHLRGCRNCSEYVEQIRAGIRLAGRTKPEPLDGDTRAVLLGLYRSWQEPS